MQCLTGPFGVSHRILIGDVDHRMVGALSVEQIINHLREAEVLLAQGQRVGEICRRIGVSEQSYDRWRREYGGLKVDQARRLKDLEQENSRLKRAVADLTLDTGRRRQKPPRPSASICPALWMGSRLSYAQKILLSLFSFPDGL